MLGPDAGVAQTPWNPLTLSPPKSGRFFSVQHGNHCCCSLKGLPNPLNVSSSILIPVQDEPAGDADMGTHGETLLHPFAAATAILRGISGWYRDHPTASVRCFAAQDGPELPPARITDALGEARILDQIGHLQIFQIDHIIGLHQPECRLMMKVPPL